MVSAAVDLILAASEASPLLFRLPPQQRLRVLAALALVILLGAVLILFAWWGARATRRYINRGPTHSHRKPGPAADDWATKPLDNGAPPADNSDSSS